MHKRNIGILVIALVVIVAATSWTVISFYNQKSTAMHGNLVKALPASFEGWVIKDIPIASSEEMKKAVGELLNYSNAVFREYRKDDIVLGVYVAYWEPRKFHPRLIAQHVPDACWVGNGWIMSKPNYNFQVTFTDGAAAWPAQYRLFDQPYTGHQHVIYWHIVNGKLSGFAQGPTSRSDSIFNSLGSDLMSNAGEQFFIRISSNVPFDELEKSPVFLAVLDTFEPVLLKK
jgi:hypothetical protein